jgi:hypothetical protein
VNFLKKSRSKIQKRAVFEKSEKAQAKSPGGKPAGAFVTTNHTAKGGANPSWGNLNDSFERPPKSIGYSPTATGVVAQLRKRGF